LRHLVMKFETHACHFWLKPCGFSIEQQETFAYVNVKYS